MRLSLVSLCFAFMLAACQPVALLNTAVSSKGYRVVSNLAYGENPRQKLDLYIPDGAPADAPIVVFYYGGRWQSGDKSEYLFAAQGLVSMGAIVAVPNYRLYPEVRYPEFLNDSARAFVWVHEHIAEYGHVPDRMYLMGHSAGAYNAAMLTLNPQLMHQAGGDIIWVTGMIGLAGPYDFLPFTDSSLNQVFSSEPELPRTQPINYAHRLAPRMLLITGTGDDTVKPANSMNLYRKLKEKGVDVTYREYPGVGHTGLILGLNTSFDWNPHVRKDVQDFLAK